MWVKARPEAFCLCWSRWLHGHGVEQELLLCWAMEVDGCGELRLTGLYGGVAAWRPPLLSCTFSLAALAADVTSPIHPGFKQPFEVMGLVQGRRWDR